MSIMSLDVYVDKVKDYLRITWDDEDEKIEDIVKRAQGYMLSTIGLEVWEDADDMDDNPPYQAVLHRRDELFYEYCRYVYTGTLVMFNHDFAQRILEVQLDYATYLGVSDDAL